MNKQQLLQKEIKMSENLSLNKDNKRKKKVLTNFFWCSWIDRASFTAYYICIVQILFQLIMLYSAVEIAQVTPSVNGIISDVLVTDTDKWLKKGDILVKLEQTDAKALEQAQASYDRLQLDVKNHIWQMIIV